MHKRRTLMLGEADVAISIGAIGLVSVGLAAMNKAYSGAFLKARTIGRARGNALIQPRAPKQAKKMADVALPYVHESCAGGERPEHGPLVYYSLRFLAEETARLGEEAAKLRPAGESSGEYIAVFSALDDDSRDAGARRLSRRLRADAVADGKVDAFPLACCLPASEAVVSGLDAMASDDPPFVSAEPPGPALAAWNLSRLKASAGKAGVSVEEARGSGLKPSKVLAVRVTGRGAGGFVRGLTARAEKSDAPAAIFAVQ